MTNTLMIEETVKEKTEQRETQGRRPKEAGGSNWDSATTKERQEQLELKEERKAPPLEPSEEASPCQHLDF